MCVGCFFLSFSLMPAEFSAAWALDLSHPRYRLQKRTNAAGQEDRTEGIEPVKIAGERLELIGAFLNVPALQADPAGTTYRLGFYLKEAESRVAIQVRDYNGMITNDKFCCIRWAKLQLSWWRRPLELRSEADHDRMSQF